MLSWNQHKVALTNWMFSFLNEEVFASLHGLLQLNLSHNRLIAFAPRNFQKLRNLQLLDLRNNPIICMSPDAFSGLSTLKEFQVRVITFTLTQWLLIDVLFAPFWSHQQFSHPHQSRKQVKTKKQDLGRLWAYFCSKMCEDQVLNVCVLLPN